MTPLLGIAFRNLLRARRRNALAGGTMVLGAAALVLGSGLSDGIARQLTANLVAVQTGHVVVLVRPDDFVAQNSPFDAYGQLELPGATLLARRIESEGRELGVVRAVPYLQARGTAIAGNRSSLATIVGIEPEREPELRAALPALSGGFLPEGDALATYIAEPMARKLRLAVGDSVSFVVQTPEGAVNSTDAIVCGVFEKNAPWYDSTFYVSLPAAQALLDWPQGATNIKVMLADERVSAARRARPAIEAIVARAGVRPREAGDRVRVESCDQAGRFSFSIIQANQTALAILSFFLFAAAGVGIVNAMLMSVHERTREIGTVRALGMRRRLVVRLFIFEGFALGVVSAALGVALGASLVLFYGARGIPMNTITLAWIAGGDVLFPALSGWSVARAAVAIAGLSTLAAVYPAYAASRLSPREALLSMFELGLGLLLLAAGPTADEIVRRADRAVLGDSASYTLRMRVARPGKAERVVEMRGWKKGDELGLVRYTAPPKERNTAYLRSGDSTFLFLPSAEKVIRVGPKQNFGGGDFSNGDIFRLSLIKDYLPTLVGEEELDGLGCYKLELKARNRSVAYDRVVYWVRRDGSFDPVRADYHTLSGKRLKWLSVGKRARLGSRERPTLLTMESALDPGARTSLEFLTIQDDVKLDDRLFTPQALERGE